MTSACRLSPAPGPSTRTHRRLYAALSVTGSSADRSVGRLETIPARTLRWPPCATRSRHSPTRSRSSSLPASRTSTARVRAGQPARDGEGGAVRPLLALPGTLRRLYLDEFAADVPGRRRARSRARRASAPRGCTSASSSATATTRSPRSAAPTSPASGSRTSSPRCSSAAGSPPTSSSRPATSPTTTRCPRPPGAATATTATTSSDPSTRAAMDELFGIYSRSLETVRAWAAERWPRGDEPERAWESSIRAKALDLLRGLLPGLDPEPRRHLRLGPGLRADAAADARLAAARGARLRDG